MDFVYLIHIGITVITFTIACNLWIEVSELKHDLWKLKTKLNDKPESEDKE